MSPAFQRLQRLLQWLSALESGSAAGFVTVAVVPVVLRAPACERTHAPTPQAGTQKQVSMCARNPYNHYNHYKNKKNKDLQKTKPLQKNTYTSATVTNPVDSAK